MFITGFYGRRCGGGGASVPVVTLRTRLFALSFEYVMGTIQVTVRWRRCAGRALRGWC